MEKPKKISNPLTIIAIFAGIADIAATTAIFGLPVEIQKTFIWFAMGFPVLLVVLFFGVLIFNHKVLYAPSDYRSDNSFIDLAVGKRALQEIDAVGGAIHDLKVRISSIEGVPSQSDDDGSKLDSKVSMDENSTNSLSDQLSRLEHTFEQARSSFNTFIGSENSSTYRDKVKSDIISFLSKEDEETTESSIARILYAVDGNALMALNTDRLLDELVDERRVIRYRKGPLNIYYKLPPK